MLRSLVKRGKALIENLQLPDVAKKERQRDHRGLPDRDPGIDRVVETGALWLAAAQDCSASHDGGVARNFSLLKGWVTSYPETSGYIVPTMIELAKRGVASDSRDRARRVLDWLVSIQFREGGFQAGRIEAQPRVPVTFNTGQILLGLAAGVAEFGDIYRDAMSRAADWLVSTQDADGCWRRHPTPFAEPGEKTYETHVAWGLLEAERLSAGRGYGAAALANTRWALTQQRDNGWLAQCCLTDPTQPLTHTLGYALRGIAEAYRFSDDRFFLNAAVKTADGLLSALRDDGYLPGRLRSDWTGAVAWACLTGSVQIAHSWLMLYQYTGNVRYRDAAFAANRYVRRSVNVDGPPEIRGGVKGSFPVNGSYGAYEYLNWACKFCIDSNLLEKDIRRNE